MITSALNNDNLFLPAGVAPLPPAESVKTWEDGAFKDAEYFAMPTNLADRKVTLDYVQLSDELRSSNSKQYVETLLDQTPKPKGRPAFSSIHIVGPHLKVESAEAERTIAAVVEGSGALGKEVHVHRLNETVCCSNKSSTTTTPMEEYNAIFEVATELLLKKADRASLLVFVGWEDTSMDAYAAFIGLLPFRGIQVALISRRRDSYGDLLHFSTPSGTFDMDGLTAARMGKYPVHTVFGSALPSKRFQEPVRTWSPVPITDVVEEMQSELDRIPFKIGGLELPMLTHSGFYESGLKILANLLAGKYPKGYTPIVSVGETCDALGYGQDVLDALLDQQEEAFGDGRPNGLLFTHKSGETYKRYDNYGSPELFQTINDARKSTKPAVILAVGGGVNGNCIGLVAAMTNVDFVEIPTTPMHYNDAVTSAKKAFSLVIDDKILSKNILGAFYLPQLAYCLNECLLTISSANAHATVGESTKTMNMLGIANSAVGAADFHNILGGVEFASDFTKILTEVEGFDKLIDFIESPSTLKKKREIIALGRKIAELRDASKRRSTNSTSDETTNKLVSKPSYTGRFVKMLQSLPSLVSLATETTDESSSDSESDNEESIEELIEERKRLMRHFRNTFRELPSETTRSILSFLTTINCEIVSAKAMFLAYSDPFEKYRALLFEYAHTLGHGVEAFANDLYLKARQKGVVIPSQALRLHGQCVGMAVLWAGEMSKNLGKLEGEGYMLHQSFPYLFNRAGGFAFHPIRSLCDDLGVTKEEFLESVLQVVRRDNKRGYCKCSGPGKSVDQLVTCRPGKMLKSDDANAEVRYLVEVDEDWQKDVLAKAWDGDFDMVADLRNGELVFVPLSQVNKSSSTRNRRRAAHDMYETSSKEVATQIRTRVLAAYAADVMEQQA